MASIKFFVILFLLAYVSPILVSTLPLKSEGLMQNEIEESRDQLTSGSVTKAVLPDAVAVPPGKTKGDLKGSDSFGLGYYLPIVGPTFVKYHYPLIYYPTTYLHSIRHHGFGYGFFHQGHGVIH